MLQAEQDEAQGKAEADKAAPGPSGVQMQDIIHYLQVLLPALIACSGWHARFLRGSACMSRPGLGVV